MTICLHHHYSSCSHQFPFLPGIPFFRLQRIRNLVHNMIPGETSWDRRTVFTWMFTHPICRLVIIQRFKRGEIWNGIWINSTIAYQHQTYGTHFPVMVYIQAESFENGDASLYGPDKLIDKDVVVVTFNYRLGLLGTSSWKAYYILWHSSTDVKKYF